MLTVTQAPRVFPLGQQKLVGEFGDGRMISDASTLLLRAMHERSDVTRRIAEDCINYLDPSRELHDAARNTNYNVELIGDCLMGMQPAVKEARKAGKKHPAA